MVNQCSGAPQAGEAGREAEKAGREAAEAVRELRTALQVLPDRHSQFLEMTVATVATPCRLQAHAGQTRAN